MLLDHLEKRRTLLIVGTFDCENLKWHPGISETAVNINSGTNKIIIRHAAYLENCT